MEVSVSKMLAYQQETDYKASKSGIQYAIYQPLAGVRRMTTPVWAATPPD